MHIDDFQQMRNGCITLSRRVKILENDSEVKMDQIDKQLLPLKYTIRILLTLVDVLLLEATT